MIEQLKVIISAETEKLKKEVDSAKEKIKSFQEQVKEASKNVDEDIAAIGASMANGFKVGAAAIVAAGAALIALAASTEEYRQNQAQLNAAFEQAKLSTESASGAYTQLYKVIGDDAQAVESAANIAMLANSEEEVAKWAELASGVLGTFHDTLQPEAFYEAANETLKLGEATGAYAQMLEQTGVMTVEEFNKQLAACGTEAEKQALMLSVSEKAMGAAGAAYNEATASIQANREAQARLNETTAKIGEIMQPVITAFTQFAGEALAVVAPYLSNFVEKLLPGLTSALTMVIEGMIAAFEWANEHKALLAALAIAIGIVVAGIGMYNVVAAIKAAMAAAEVTTLGGLIAAHLAHAMAVMASVGPYILLAAAIAALIALVVVIIDNWDLVGEAFEKVGQKIKKACNEAVEWVQNLADKIKGAFSNFDSWISNLFSNAADGVKNAFSNVGSWFGSQVTKIKNAFSGIGSWFGKEFQNGVTAIKKAFNTIPNFFSTIFSNIQNIFSNIGNKISEGLTKGVKSAVNKVLSKAVDVINAAIAGINGAINFINMIPGVNVSMVSELTVPKLAKGGVVDSATLAMIGERGTEAVLPLENNLEYLDKLAKMLNDRMGVSNTPIVLQVDGKTLAQTSINSINQLTKQTGKLQLVLA